MVRRPSLGQEGVDSAGQCPDLLPPRSAQELCSVGAVEQPALLLPAAEARRPADDLIENGLRDVAGSAVNGGEVRLELLSSSPIGNAPRAEKLDFGDGIDRSGVDEPSNLTASLALLIRLNH